jgi:hypothetical protein
VIPRDFITEWRDRAPWASDRQVEQDLVISRALVELYSDPTIAKELAFRGGAALYKLHVQPAVRYSEDIDLVQTEPGAIGPALNAIRARLDGWLGKPHWKQSEARVTLSYHFEAEDLPPVRLKLKVEINSREHFSVYGVKNHHFEVRSRWFSGAADVRTYELDELLGTKLRALYQRKKGRDLFDLWLALNELRLRPADILACFPPYRPEGYTAAAAIANLQEKTADRAFVEDLNQLVTAWPPAYSVQVAANQVISELLTPLDGGVSRPSSSR